MSVNEVSMNSNSSCRSFVELESNFDSYEFEWCNDVPGLYLQVP